MSRWIVAAAFLASTNLAAQAPSPTDWPNLHRFAEANAELAPPAKGEDRVVFMGNSITEGWSPLFGSLFPGKPYIGRGISGQTTPQMLIRFRQDVVALKPSIVVILAGTNDIAGNTGPSTLGMIEDNIASMTEIALSNGIDVLLCSVLPVYDYPWKKGLQPASKIDTLNAWLRDYASHARNSDRNAAAAYVDFHSAMKDDRDGLRAELTRDGVHPNEAGYRVMSPIVEQAIERQLKRRHAVR